MATSLLLRSALFVTWILASHGAPTETSKTEVPTTSQVTKPQTPPFNVPPPFIPPETKIAPTTGSNPVSGQTTAFSPVYTNQELNQDLTKLLTDIATRVENFGRNPFDPDQNISQKRIARASEGEGKHTDADLRESGHDSDTERDPERSEGFIKEEDHDYTEDTEEHSNPSDSSKRDYCERYEQHFSYFCVGESNSDDPSITRFCPSYQSNCPHMASKSPLTPWPADPFSAPISIKSSSSSRKREDQDDESESEEEEIDETKVYYSALRKRFPCKPDCDERLFPHCTAECKCDYIYPTVQKFCNPPPMPIFLNTCRLWYNGCPKYDRYHYASQFVYNKANKGKTITPSNYGISQPDAGLAGFPQVQSAQPYPRPQRRTSQLIPIMHGTKLVTPPDLPLDLPHASALRSDSSLSFDGDSSSSKLRRSSDKNSSKSSSRHSRRRRHRKRKSANDNSSYYSQRSHTTTEAPAMSRRELYNKLKVLNDLTSNPVSIVKKIRDPASYASQFVPTDESNKQETDPHSRDPASKRPRASDVTTTDDDENDPFKNVDRWGGLTDSRGIYHRPRSSSPFTKPGLWEPNPDDPHSRDPTNKYWYHPESVGVDWLNGQMTWGAHWAVPAAGVGGTDGFSALHFPSIGTFLNIPDDYD